MTKKMPLALALMAGIAISAPSLASACAACGGAHHYTSGYTYSRQVRVAAPVARYHYTATYAAPAPACQPVVCRPVVCRPVCDPCDPCRRSGLFGLGILGIL